MRRIRGEVRKPRLQRSYKGRICAPKRVPEIAGRIRPKRVNRAVAGEDG